MEISFSYLHNITNNMTDSITQTRKFMLAAGQACPDKPIQPYEDEHEAMLKLRLGLCLEELYELAQAFGLEGTFQLMLEKRVPEVMCREENGVFYDYAEDTHTYDTIAVLDALADMRVVADGTVLACGLAGAFPAALDEVHRSNMSKFPSNKQEAEATVAFYANGGVIAEWYKEDDKLIVRRVNDNKILKSIGYSPANLKFLVP